MTRNTFHNLFQCSSLFSSPEIRDTGSKAVGVLVHIPAMLELVANGILPSQHCTTPSQISRYKSISNSLATCSSLRGNLNMCIVFHGGFFHPPMHYDTGLAVNMARYCTSVYFSEPKARENTAHECNISPY